MNGCMYDVTDGEKHKEFKRWRDGGIKGWGIEGWRNGGMD